MISHLVMQQALRLNGAGYPSITFGHPFRTARLTNDQDGAMTHRGPRLA